MKNTLLFLMFIFVTLQGKACLCESSESNFYKNLSSDKTILLAVMENISIGNEYNERIELGNFRLLDIIYDSGNISITDTFVVSGRDGINCGENLSQFNIGDTLFLTFGSSWDENTQSIYLEGCNTNYMKVEEGKCKGLPLADVIQKINNSIDQSMSCGCSPFEYVFDFYSNVKKPYSFCFASFMRFDYSVEWNDRFYQTAYFKVLDTIGNFNLPVNSTIVVLGENGINCGEMFEKYEQGDSLILALDAPPFNPLLPDTFLLKGHYCGSHVLGIKNGVDIYGDTYASIKAKMISIITYEKSFQTNENCFVYPNPIRENGILNVSNSDYESYLISDIYGQSISSGILNKTVVNKIPIINFRKGIYFISLRKKEFSITDKLIVN